ncbi:MAG: hypothetical protein IH921_10980 [Gemmatimonadetes bacterium]|nr:hypothetical protein [Gemmatimonadota bacterium]
MREVIGDALNGFIKKGLVEQQGLDEELVDVAIGHWNEDKDPQGPFEHGAYAVIKSIFTDMHKNDE